MSLTVQEDDFLPKVVCSKCLQNLETCFSFRQECLSSESMLSSYFKKFRSTEDFKKSGKVYIKDTKNSDPLECEGDPLEFERDPLKCEESAAGSDSSTAIPTIIFKQSTCQHDELPIYTLQLPISSGSNFPKNVTKLAVDTETKISSNVSSKKLTDQLPTFNLNTLNLSAIKTMKGNSHSLSNTMVNNVTVNSHGEVLNIEHLVDLESGSSQNQNTKNGYCKKIMSNKEDILKLNSNNNESVVNVNNFDTGQVKYNKLLSNQKNININKSTYIKRQNKQSEIQAATSQTSAIVYKPLTGQYNHFNITSRDSKNIDLYQQNIPSNSLDANSLTLNSNLISDRTATELNVNTGVLNSQQISLDNLPTRENNTYSNINSVPVTIIGDRKIVVQAIVDRVPESNENSITLNDKNLNNDTSDENKATNKSNNDKSHICEICSKCFKRREHLYQHVKLHSGFRPFVCDYCNKAFMRKEHLLRHMTLHSGQKNFTCNVCDKSFSRNDNLLKHKKTHEKQTKYECDICLKTFVMKHYYIAHKMTHQVLDALKT